MARYLIHDEANTTHAGVIVAGEKVCVDVRRSDGIDIVNMHLKPTTEKYAAGIRASYSKKPEDGNGTLRFDGLIIDNMGSPSTPFDYGVTNNDNMSIEIGNRRVLVKRSDLKGAYDACIDMKGSLDYPLEYMSAATRYGPAHRQVRVRSGVTATFANDEFTPASGKVILWFKENAGNVIFYNCKFHLANGTTVTQVPLEYISSDNSDPGTVANRIEYATEDPLKGVDFFQDEPEEPAPAMKKKFRFIGEIEEI